MYSEITIQSPKATYTQFGVCFFLFALERMWQGTKRCLQIKQGKKPNKRIYFTHSPLCWFTNQHFTYCEYSPYSYFVFCLFVFFLLLLHLLGFGCFFFHSFLFTTRFTESHRMTFMTNHNSEISPDDSKTLIKKHSDWTLRKASTQQHNHSLLCTNN